MRFTLLFSFILIMCLQGSLGAIENSMGQIRGVQKPEKILEYVRKDLTSSSLNEPSMQRCYVFLDFVAVEIDTGQVGADEISIRPRSREAKLENLCSEKKFKGEIPLKVEEQYVLGAVGNFILTISADGAGEERGLWIYDVKTGKQLFEAGYHEHREFRVISQSDDLSLEYFSRMKLSCDLTQEKPDCWAKTLRENQVASSVKLQKPDCDKVLKSKDFRDHPELVHEPRALQLFARVQVKNVRKPQMQYADGAVLCHAAP